MFSSLPCTVLLECGSCCIVLSTSCPLQPLCGRVIHQNCQNSSCAPLTSRNIDSFKQPPEALSDDFLFPMTSRLSYASSPESDLETGPESRTPSKSLHHHPPPHNVYPDSREPSRSRMVKSSSDPSLAAPEDTEPSAYGGPPPYTASPTRIVSVMFCVVSFINSTHTHAHKELQVGTFFYQYFVLLPHTFGPV